MAAPRGEFSSRFGFLMAASGSAVGLGNIWGFPTNAASNGGAAFLFAYLILAFALAYPALMAELIIGRYARANAVTALRAISPGDKSRMAALAVGFAGIVTVSFILSFYAIVSGWMIAFFFDPLARLLGMDGAAQWLTTDAVLRNSIFVMLFMTVTVFIISAGVKDGIEKWASRLMPSLIVILILLIIYVLTLPGASDGLRAYLVPDFSRLTDPALLVDAMGQAFFSLSLGVGTMLIYGSYISKQENLPTTGGLVALLDIGIAVLAGLLILPAMYVALANGVEIFDDGGGLIAGPGLIVSVLPALFNTMGAIGVFVAIAFFLLMTIASLTSSISMLEVPVAYGVEHHGLERRKAALFIGSVITVISSVIVFNFDPLFDMVVTFTTEISQPLLGFAFCIFVAWIWRRNDILQEIKQGAPQAEQGLFWKIWPFYVKFICPVAILVVYFQ
ncbi:MAG: sodium-dependent transporter [Gammaproteobacteria bacterium]|nr:sodium-dependent transporter [Gammaproteobacteria bacterium]MDD9895988.1 sodium-dependent transporter [Gammaproteobacteria bacterium]MDD9960052.1 sodium-dependent transporter [Gammaproteobacteria bacterium]